MKTVFLFLSLNSFFSLLQGQEVYDFGGLSTEQLYAAIETQACAETYMLKQSVISEENVAWMHRVWRKLTIADNPILEKPNLGRSLGAILYQGVFDGGIIAFDSKDDRFTALLTYNEVMSMKTIDWSSVSSFMLKEDWIYLKEEKKVVCRILGIAPVKDGQPLFWLYYPAIREYLVNFEVKTADTRMDNLDKFFECHSYKAIIVKRVE